MSPQRTREHELEDESRRAFEAALPKEWVVRAVGKDYGIDTEVEIFADGEATGLTFKVQLKGTDKLHNRPPHRSIKLSHLRYWQSLDVPVLIALYVAESQAIYVKWSFSHDPGRKGYSQKTTTVTFDDRDLIGSRVASLESELLLYRPLRSGWLPRPVPLNIISSGEAMDRYKLVSQFRRRLFELDLQDVVRITTDETEPSLRVSITKRLLSISMPLNAGSMSLHAMPKQDLTASTEESIRDVLVVLASLLSTRDRTADALRICIAAGPCEAWFLPEIAGRICHSLTEESRTDIGVRIAKYLTNEYRGDLSSLLLAEQYAKPAQEIAATLGDEQRNDLVGLLREIGDCYLRIDQAVGAAAQHFNAASVCSAVDRYDEALSELVEAGDIFPDLLENPRYLVITGRNAFCADRPDLAAEMYGKAVALGLRNSEVLAWYADALFASGKFEQAQSVISGEYGAELIDQLSVVNRMACREIMELTGLKSQEIRELTDEEISAVEEDPEVAFDLITNVNALLFMLWYRLEPEPSEWSTGRACLLSRLNVKAAAVWAYATMLAYETFGVAAREFQGIVEMAIDHTADEYLELLGRALSEEEESDSLQEVVKFAHEVALRTPEKPGGFGVYGMSPFIDSTLMAQLQKRR